MNETPTDFDNLRRILRSQRAIRLFEPGRDVDDALIEQAIGAARFAPSGGNSQPWRFIVIRDPAVKRQLGLIFDELGRQNFGDHAPERTPWEEVPALIAVCATGGSTASIYPVVQNLLLSIQALGLGSVLTTRWKAREIEVRALLDLPENLEPQAILPVGWPARKYGRGTRKPVAEITYRERFGNPW